jgi:hypothetical protein
MTDEMLFAEHDRLVAAANAEYRAGVPYGIDNHYFLLFVSINRDALAAARARRVARWEAEEAAAEAAETE